MKSPRLTPPIPDAPLRRLALLGVAFGIVLLSCGRDVTSPRASARVARGLAWHAQFPPAYQAAGSGASSLVDFNRVHVVLHHSDGTIALDTVINFPAGADSILVSLDVSLLPSAPESGEPLTLTLGYINAAGDTVFRGGPVGVTATPAVAGQPPPPPVTIPVTYSGPGSTAVGVQISPRSGSVFSGGSFDFTAVAVDNNGTAIPNTPIVWNTLDPSIASIPSAAHGTVLAGDARGAARIVAQLLTGPTDQVTLRVLPRATAIALQSGSGQSALAGASLANPLVAIVTAGDGLGVSGVTVTFAVASGGGSVGTASAVTDNGGLAQTTWRLGSAVGTQTVTASAASLSGSPVTFSATAGSPAPTKLAIAAQPANTTAGAVLAPLVVVVQDASSGTVSTFTGAVSVAFGNNTAGAALGGTTTVNAVAGIATFANLTVNHSGTGYTLVASSAGLASATSSAFDIAAAAVNKLEFTLQPVSTTAGSPMSGSVTVAAEDLHGNAVTSFTGVVTLALASNPGAGVLGGVTSAAAVAGVATFTGVTVNRPGSGYTLSASAAGLSQATSAAFDIAIGPPALLSVSSGAGQSASINSALAQPIVVLVTDLGGNGVAGATVTFAVAGGGGSLSVASGVSGANGQVSTVWTLGSTVGGQSMTATSTGLAGSPLTIGATGTAALNHFIVTTQPAVGQVAGITVTPGFVVSALDALNNPIPGFTGTVTLAIGTNPGGAMLSGTMSVSAVVGVATFSAFSLDKAANGYTVVANSAGFTGVTSNLFNIVAGAAASIAITSGSGQSAPASTALAAQLVATVTDIGGNPVAGTTVTFAVATGGGSVSAGATVSSAAGRDSTNWTLGPTVGAQTVTATAAGLIGSPLTFTATGGGGIVTTTVAPHTTTMTSLGDVFTLTATARDAASNVVAGSYLWTSKTPAVATVNAATGVVTAVTNGTAYVVATEAGGTKDSALVTVAQAVATINVTPSSRNIYLGANFTFTAQAVDGHANPLAVQPTFTWSSTAPVVASVSAAGLVNGLNLGATQIRATAGAITGVSNVNIVTVIQQIYVARDSAGFPTNASDVFNMAALLLHRSYKAYAYDTLGAVMSGITFVFNSSNPSVAILDSTGAATVRAKSVANGNVSILATAQGVSGSAQLTVAQVLASIAITPAAPSVAVGGSVSLTARGQDSNAQFIAGGVFNWTSGTPANATVNAATGVVTGVANGTTNVTANIGAIVSPPDVVTVTPGATPIISFGRDTVSVGRGSTAQVPILLSRPSGSPVVVNLAVADTFAFWSSASVTIPAGQTSINAQINGHNAGTTTITAIDQASVYATATSVLAVQASMHLTSGGYSLNATDQLTTQVLLSDPSPVGGTFVTFSYSTPGVASVSPSPAFIPAGQLAATIVITGVAAGSTNITPVAIGVNGTASSWTTYAPNLTFSYTFIRLGAGQYDQSVYVYAPTYTVNALPVTFTSSNPAVATVTASSTIPAGSYYSYMTITAVAPGSTTITVSSPGWTGVNTVSVVVTTPHVGIYGGTTLNTTSPAQSYTVLSEDSTRSAHYRTSSLVTHVSSSNPAVLTVLDSVVTIAPNSYYNSSPRVIPGGTGGTALLIVTAGGHTPDTTAYTVIGPKLEFSWFSNRVGLGQEDDNVYVTTPNNVVAPLVVTLSGDTSITGFPPTVTIPTGSYYAYFSVRGKTVGSVPIIASAPGYQGDTSTYVVTSPHLVLGGGGTLNNFSPPTGFTVYATDSLGSAHYRTTPLAVTFTSTNPAVLTVDAGATINAGYYYANTQQVQVVGVGTTLIIASAPGHKSDTLSYTVVTPQLNVTLGMYTLGAREHRNPNEFYAYVPNYLAAPLTVTFTDNHPEFASLSSTSLTIGTGVYYAYFTFAGLTPGIDTVTATAPGYLPTTFFIRVTTQKLTNGGLPGSTTTTNPPIAVTVYATDSLGSAHYASDSVVLHAVSSNPSVIQPQQAYTPIVKGNYYAQPLINIVGPGTATITFTDSAGIGFGSTTTNAITVTGPSLALSNTNFMLGERQNTGVNGIYVYAPNNVATPLVVTLTSTDPSVAIPVPSTVTIPTGLYYAYFQVNAQDATGTIQIQANATGYSATSATVQVTPPKFVIGTSTQANTTGSPQGMTIYAADANGSAHYTNENVTITLVSTAPTVATMDSATVTIPAGVYYHNTAHWIPLVAGTSQLQFQDNRAVSYKYGTGTVNIQVNTPTLTLNNFNTLGIGQYADSYFYVSTPDYQTSPLTVTLSHAGTARTSAPATVTVPASLYYAYFRLIGTVAGTDTLVASATSPAHNPATGYTVVGNGRIDPLLGWPGSSVHVGDSVLVYIYARDPGTNVRNVVAATTFTLAPNANIQFVSGGVGSAVITTATIAADAQYVTFYLKAVAAGTGSATITATNYTAYTNTMTVIP